MIPDDAFRDGPFLRGGLHCLVEGNAFVAKRYFQFRCLKRSFNVNIACPATGIGMLDDVDESFLAGQLADQSLDERK